MDKNNGDIDKTTIKFAGVWGKKKVNSPNFRERIHPYVWKNDNQAGWYIYKPTPQDMELLCVQISDYAELFMEQSMGMKESNDPRMEVSI